MKKFLLCAVVFISALTELQAQQRTVTGKVTSEDDGSSLPGVNVVVKGTSNGTVTDVDGVYNISVADANAVLVFTFVGMATKEVEVGSNSTVDVQLAMDVTQLNEVVVNAIGDVVPKDKLGSSPSTVTGSAVTQSGEAGVINGLAGKAAGLNITRNGGDPGAGTYIQIRGQNTVTGSTQPLIVIDGMPMFNSYQDSGNQVDGVQQQSRLNDLNPNDIQSIEVIKSASAAALWGSRAANGVIVITTKKGTNTKGKLNLTYNGTVSFDQVNKVPDLQRSYGQGSSGNSGLGSGTQSWGDKIANRSGGPDTYITDPAADGYAGYVQFPDGTKRYAISQKNSKETYDHSKDVFRTGHYVENNVSLSGGNDRSNIFMSYSNLDQDGIIKENSNYKKNTFRVNASTMLSDKLQLSSNMSYASIKSNRAQQGSNLGGIFLGGLRTPPDFDNSQYVGTYFDAEGVAIPNRQVSYRNPIGANAAGFDNPLWTIRNNKSYSGVSRFVGNLELNYELTDWLNLKANGGVDTYTDRRTDYVNAQSAITPDGSYQEETIQETQWNINTYAQARKKFSDLFSGSLDIGFNFNQRNVTDMGAIAYKFIVPDAPPNFANTDPSNRIPFNSQSTRRTAAAFFSLNADIANQVFINITGRGEAASTFGPQAQSLFYYPSASVAWQFSQLIPNKSFLNFGKLRLSYGVVGNEPGPYLNLTQYPTASYSEAWGGTLAGGAYGVGGYQISNTVGNPVIKPERKHETEGGFDLRFFQDRLGLSFTAYYNKVTDLILPVDVAASAGFANRVANAGTLENKGMEISLDPVWVKRPNFQWSSSFMYYFVRNKVTYLSGIESVFLSGGGFSDGSSRAVEGHPVGALWGTYYDTNPNGGYVLDANGFPRLAASEGVIGNPNPKFRASVGNTFRWKGFTLYGLLDMMAGGEMWNGTRGALVSYGVAKSTDVETTVSAADAANIRTFDGYTIATIQSVPALANRVTHNGDGSYTFRGTVGDFGGGKVALDQAWYTNTGGGFNVNGAYVEKANWTRLREVTLSYSFNGADFRRATKLNGITVGVTGRNLALWTPYSGVDPETNLTGANIGRGIDYFQNPNTKSILFKLTITY